MKEILELRVHNDYAHLLFKENEGKHVGNLVKVIEISTDDPRYNQIPIVSKQVKEKYDTGFYFGWQFKRLYSKKEIAEAELFHVKIKSVFEPTGEDCKTLYDETVACKICGANRKQITPLILKKGTIPKKDIAKTIGGEVIVSERVVNAVKQRGLKGLVFSPVYFEKGISNYYQLTVNIEVELSSKTITGDNPFEKSSGSDGGTYYICGYEMKSEPEVYICPKGDLIGLNLLSESYVLNSPPIKNVDFFASKQKIGVKRGLLRPEPIYLCSPAFRNMILEEKLSGFEFEIAHIV
jgi:hypothetical protein